MHTYAHLFIPFCTLSTSPLKKEEEEEKDKEKKEEEKRRCEIRGRIEEDKKKKFPFAVPQITAALGCKTDQMLLSSAEITVVKQCNYRELEVK